MVSDMVPTVATTGDGLYEGLDWLAQTLSSDTSQAAKDGLQSKKQEKSAESADTGAKMDESSKVLTKSWHVFKSLFVAT